MIAWDQIEISNNKSGEIRTTCPSCSHTRKKPKDKCLAVNIDKGLAKCWNCEDVSVRDLPEKKEYNLPPQEWQNFTNLPDAMVKYLKGRGISQQTAIKAKITCEEYYQPSEEKKVPNIVFNYFEGDKLINKKFRSAKKSFTQIKNAKKIFYGLNDIIGAKEVYIVEGEMDKISLMELGIINCISVPNGANDMNDVFETCERYIKDIEKFYIAVDMDDQGAKLEGELIKRLGKWRCERIKFKGKDANEDLINDRLGLEETIKKPIPYPIDGTFTANDIEDEIIDLYRNGLESTIKPKGQDFREFNKIFSILRGQLTVGTGIPSHGKSNFIEWYILNLVNDNDLKASFYSPEHLPMKLHHSVLAEKVVGKPFHNSFAGFDRMTESELRSYNEWSSERIYLTVPEKGDMADWDWLIEKWKEQIFRFGIDIFVVDAFNKVKRNHADSLGEISEILSRLTLFVQTYDVHLFLIAHPTKMQKEEKSDNYKIPGLYDVKGSGDFRDQSHNGLCVHRYFTDDNDEGRPHTKVINLKIKFKHQGEIGESCKFHFQPANGRYAILGESFDMVSMINKQPIEINTADIFESEGTQIIAPF